MVAVVSDAGRAKRLFAEAYDASADGFARSADRLVYGYLARPLARALGEAVGPVLDVAAGSGALGRLLPAAVALDLSAAQLRHNPLPVRLQGDAERLPFRDGAFAAAGCAFGINHFPDPGAAVAEMARVAPLVGLLTWSRPEAPYRPKQAVMEVVARHAGSDRTAAGILADELGERVGSPAAVRDLLEGAGLRPEVAEVEVDLPWPGAAAFVDYRLATVGVAGLVDDPATVRRQAIAAVAALPPRPSPGRPGWCSGSAAAVEASASGGDDHPVAVRVGDLGHALAPGLVGRLGQHADPVPAQVVDGGVAVVGVHPEREAATVRDRPVGAGADAEVGPAKVQGHIGRLPVGREPVADLEAEQVPVEAERPWQVAGGQDREQLLEHRPSRGGEGQERPALVANFSAQSFQVPASSGTPSSRSAAAWS